MVGNGIWQKTGPRDTAWRDRCQSGQEFDSRFGFHSKLHGKPLWILNKVAAYVKGGPECCRELIKRRKVEGGPNKAGACSSPGGVRKRAAVEVTGRDKRRRESTEGCKG